MAFFSLCRFNPARPRPFCFRLGQKRGLTPLYFFNLISKKQNWPRHGKRNCCSLLSSLFFIPIPTLGSVCSTSTTTILVSVPLMRLYFSFLIRVGWDRSRSGPYLCVAVCVGVSVLWRMNWDGDGMVMDGQSPLQRVHMYNSCRQSTRTLD